MWQPEARSVSYADAEHFCILLVEDNEDDVELTQMAFAGNEVTHLEVVRDGKRALDYLRHEGEYADTPTMKICLVLLDLHLPKIDGIEVLQTIRASDSLATLPVVVLSSSDRADDIETAYRSGCNTYIQKPIKLSDFQDTMTTLQKYWGQLAKIPVR